MYPEKEMTMYPENIYIQNHEEVKSMGGDIGVCLDKYDHKHGLTHDDLARAQYCHWRSVATGVPELLSMPDKQLLIEKGFIEPEE